MQARSFEHDQLAEQLSPHALRKNAGAELASVVPMLRRLPRRSTGSAARSSTAASASMFATRRRGRPPLPDPACAPDRAAFLAATFGLMAVLMLGLHGGPSMTESVTLYRVLRLLPARFHRTAGTARAVVVFRLGAS